MEGYLPDIVWTTLLHITNVRDDNLLKKKTGDLRPSEQIIYRNDPLGA